MIKNINGLYYVFNKEGTKKLSKACETKKQAEERLKEIESFKEDEILEDAYKDEEYEDAEYQGKKVTLNKPFRNKEGNSKFSVYVKNEKGNIIKVNFGDPNMEIKRDDPERRKAFRERHNCEEKKDKTTAGYWSCKFWSSESVSSLIDENIKGTYVARKVKQSKELYDFFKNQNIDVVSADELHCTIAYSKKEFTPKIDNNPIEIKYDEDIYPYLEPLGDEGAIVMKFKSNEMQERFKDCIDRGAIYDYDEYIPHITISYNGKDLNLKDIKMPDFNIDLIDEYSTELDLNWKDKVLKDSIYTIDKGFNQFEKYIDKQTGFLHINGIVARTGIQDYLGLELGDKENPTKTFGVYRPKEEVLKQESLDSYINSIVTDNHPQEFVTTDNIKELGKGSTSSIETFEKDGIDYVKAKMTITDKNLINKVLDGKVEISAGYTQDLIKEKGEFQGKSYDYKQTNIRINHVAIVDKGRCGDKCKITTDNYNIIESENNLKGENPMVKLKIGDAEVEVCDTVYSHINSLNDSIKAKDAEMEKLKGENEKLKEDMEEEKAKTADASTIDTLVSEKVSLIDTAKTLKVEVKATDSIMDIKKTVIASKSKISLDGKSEEFIDGVYQTVIASTVGKQESIKDSQKKAFDGFDGNAQKQSKFLDMAKETL